MNIFFLPVPLWLLLTVVVVIAVVFDHRHRRLQRRVRMLDREFSNMDRWADVVEEKLNATKPSITPRAANVGHFYNNERLED